MNKHKLVFLAVIFLAGLNVLAMNDETVLISSSPESAPLSTPTVRPSDFGLKEGDLISAIFSDDPDVYIINDAGYKRLFLNPDIFKFYGHLGGFFNVKLVTPAVRDAFVTSGLFRNCEINDGKVYGVSISGEDSGQLRWVNVPGSSAVFEDPAFFKKVFCINDKEFRWYPKSNDFKSVRDVPKYERIKKTISSDYAPEEKIKENAKIKDEGKVFICHYPAENESGSQTLLIAPDAVKAHLAHGDKLGKCAGDQAVKSYDKSNPVLSGFEIKNITENTATIVWTSDERIDARIKYGPVYNKFGFSVWAVSEQTASGSFVNTALLKNLVAGTDYYYIIKANDTAGNGTVSPEMTFKTPGTSVMITNFDQCKAAGYTVYEGMPSKCITPDGYKFIGSNAWVEVSSFETCNAAGYPLYEGNPSKCVTPYGVKYYGPNSWTVVSSFEQCKAAGYPVYDTVPRICKTPYGEKYYESTE